MKTILIALILRKRNGNAELDLLLDRLIGPERVPGSVSADVHWLEVEVFI